MAVGISLLVTMAKVILKAVGGEATDVAEDFPAGTTIIEAMKALDKGLLKKTVAVKINDVATDITTVLSDSDVELTPVTVDTPEGVEIYRHSAAHIMAEAVRALFKGVKLAIGPTIENGFYYDFDVETPFTPEDLVKIEKKMKEIVRANRPFSREELSREDAIKLFSTMGEDYKVELIEELPEGDTITIYRQGDDFVDLCRGPHLPSTGRLKAYKLTTQAGAYWRGDEKNKMLQRIYGVAFAEKHELAEHLKMLEEAKKRDHRRLGKDLDLFSMNEDTGPGLVLWHPKGAMVRHLIEDFWKKQHIRGGYDLINTPHVAKVDLWKKSGHWDFYQDSLYSPMDVDGQDYIVKPMNCPFHIQIYSSRLRSYRDLPIRYAELGTVYRYERSGVLHGLLRVRGFTQDDAHIYMTPDQLEGEIQEVLKFTLYILKSFGFNEYDIYLSTRPDKYVGTLENWAQAEGALKSALESEGLDYEIDPGEGVFYGPKIDIKIKDVLGRSWQCSTVQVDFNLPERFDITYRNDKGESVRPIMIHRALMGSLERFFGCLIEHYAGAFPTWLAPVQCVILTVTERNDDYAEKLAERLKKEGFRVELDVRNEKLGFKIREARLAKIPYMLVTGDKECEEGLVAPRSRDTGEMEAVTVEDFILHLREDVAHGGGSL